MDTQSAYQTTLGPKFLARSRIIFGILTISLLVVLIAGTYQGIESGDFNRSLIQPFRQFAKDFKATTETQPATPSATLQFEPVYIATPAPTPQAYTAPKKVYTQTVIVTPAPQTNSGQSYEQAVQEMNAKADQQYQDALKKQQAWADQQKAAGQAWLQQQSQQDQAAAKAQYDADVQKMQQDTEAWKKAHGF